MDNETLKAIAERRSIRSYKSDKVTREQWDALLAAAKEAPSARNSQPWHFSVTENRELLKEIYEEVEKNIGQKVGDIFYAAPGVIFLSCDASTRWGRLDCGIAVENIALAAHSIGLGSVILGMPEAAFTGPRGAYFNEKLKFPDGYSFAVAIAVGAPAASKEAHPQEEGHIDFIA
jgi:nitroreductase